MKRGAAHAGGRLNLDPSAARFDQPLAQRESYAGMIPRFGRKSLKNSKNALVRSRRNARAVVRHRKYAVTSGILDSNGDGSNRQVMVLERIVGEIAQHT